MRCDRLFCSFLILLTASLAIGCGDSAADGHSAGTDGTSGTGDGDGDGAASGGLEIAGAWMSNFGATETLTDIDWDQGFGASAIVEFDNETNILVTQIPDDADYDPGTFSTTVWTEPANNGFHYCTFGFAQATAAEAAAAQNTSDDSDLDGEGCGGFGWTRLDLVE